MSLLYTQTQYPQPEVTSQHSKSNSDVLNCVLFFLAWIKKKHSTIAAKMPQSKHKTTSTNHSYRLHLYIYVFACNV